MPVMDGLSFIKAVRARDEYKFVPILMLTTESQAEMKAQGKAAGATGWLVKPFNPEMLLAGHRQGRPQVSDPFVLARSNRATSNSSDQRDSRSSHRHEGTRRRSRSLRASDRQAPAQPRQRRRAGGGQRPDRAERARTVRPGLRRARDRHAHPERARLPLGDPPVAGATRHPGDLHHRLGDARQRPPHGRPGRRGLPAQADQPGRGPAAHQEPADPRGAVAAAAVGAVDQQPADRGQRPELHRVRATASRLDLRSSSKRARARSLRSATATLRPSRRWSAWPRACR